MKNNKKESELATFTILNPDFHIIEDQLDQEMTKEKTELTSDLSENVD